MTFHHEDTGEKLLISNRHPDTFHQGRKEIAAIASFSKREKLASQYARLISQTSLKFPREFIDELKQNFTERELVILASTAAQVNYWARLVQALGIPPAGFTDQCAI